MFTSSSTIYFIPGFTPTMVRFLSGDTIPNEDCRVFVLWCRSTSHLTCQVLSHQSHQSYDHTVNTSVNHTFMHIYIHAYMHSCTYIHIKKSYVHDCINHPESWFNNFPKRVIPIVSDPEISPSIYYKWQVPQTVRFTNIPFQSPKCHPRCVGSQMSLNMPLFNFTFIHLSWYDNR